MPLHVGQSALRSLAGRRASALARGLKLLAAERCDETRRLSATFDSGETGTWPYVWLRDNSPDEATYHIGTNTRARNLLMRQLQLDVQPQSIALSPSGSRLSIRWPGLSTPADYTARWLADRMVCKEDFRRRRRHALHDWNREHWDRKTIEEKLPKCDWGDVIGEDRKALVGFMKRFLCYGLGVIEGVPQKVGQMEIFADVLGYIRNSHYGTTFTVKSEARPGNLAYTSQALGLHTDLPYCLNPPDIQALHCVQQAGEGGHSQFADGFRAVDAMRRDDPELYRALHTVPIEYLDHGRVDYDFIVGARRPFLKLGEDGRPTAIYSNNQQRSWFVDGTLDEIEAVYAACKRFNDLCYRPENLFRIKLDSGSLVLFANNRVLHGRDEYTPEAGRQRHLVGAYFAFDAAASLIRVQAYADGSLRCATVESA